LAPALRYTFAGFLGVELGALLPAYDPGGPYPAVATLNLVGFPALLVGMAKPMRFW
jgi:hypothetical protein